MGDELERSERLEGLDASERSEVIEKLDAIENEEAKARRVIHWIATYLVFVVIGVVAVEAWGDFWYFMSWAGFFGGAGVLMAVPHLKKLRELRRQREQVELLQPTPSGEK